LTEQLILVRRPCSILAEDIPICYKADEPESAAQSNVFYPLRPLTPQRSSSVERGSSGEPALTVCGSDLASHWSRQSIEPSRCSSKTAVSAQSNVFYPLRPLTPQRSSSVERGSTPVKEKKNSLHWSRQSIEPSRCSSKTAVSRSRFGRTRTF
jgi:hypothetical protein